MTVKLGIIGYPLGHTLSPVMQIAALSHYGLEGSYDILETPPDELINRFKYLKKDDYKGFNITIPHKVASTLFLSSVDDYANIAGAVNTVLVTDKKDLIGYNTDINGFVEAIPYKIAKSLDAKKAVILGSGGAARAVAIGLVKLGINDISFYSRNQEKALHLRKIIIDNFPDVKVHNYPFIEFLDLSYAAIVVNTTPIGMQGVDKALSPLSKESVETLNNDCVVYDIIYRPKTTKLLQYAKEKRLLTIEGAEMLIYQGAKAFEIWTEKTAPVEVMRKALLKGLVSG